MKRFVVLLVSLAAACSHPSVTVDAPSAEPLDAAPSASGAEADESVSRASACLAACTNLRARKCPAGAPTPEGATCESVCVNALRSGIAPLDTQCLAHASSCAAADRCGSAGSAP
jgi:hypothetical protein